MKYIITETQHSDMIRGDKMKNILISHYRKGMSISALSKLTLLSSRDITLQLLDEPLDLSEYHLCHDLNYNLYSILFPAKLLEKKHVYDDGSTYNWMFDSLSGSIDFAYTNPEGIIVYGWATMFWDGNCDFPIQLSNIYNNGEDTPSSQQVIINVSEYLEDIKTLRNLANFFNSFYFENVKIVIDEMLLEFNF